MSDTVKNNIKVAIMAESTEGTYLAPASGADFISPLADGLEINPSFELVERTNLNSSIGKTKPRAGIRSVNASISVECKAHGTEGSKPEYGPLLESALGAVRQITTTTTTKASGNTGSVLQIEDADISKFNVNDVVMIKESGAYHVSPITAKSTGTGTATITLLVPKASGSFSNSVVISKSSVYYTANSGHPTISVSKYVEDARLEQAAGCRVTSMSLNNFSTGGLADLAFSMEGLNYDHSLTAPAYTPSFDSALPPMALKAYVYQNGTAVAVNEISMSVENTIAFKTSTASENGKISSRVTQRTVSGSFNPFKQSDSVANFDAFNNETSFSMFFYMAIPTSTAGEFKDVVAFYLPDCMITEYSEGDADGMLQEALSFQSTRGSSGSTEELYIATI